MKKEIFILLITISLLGCKSDKKNENNETASQNDSIENVVEIKKITFEDSLIDLRDVDVKFNKDYKIEKFGIEKINDTVFQFVLKLHESTTNEMVQSLSLGVQVYNEKTPKGEVISSYAPEIDIIEKQKYIRLRAVLPSTKYIDSLDIYSYQRKNWKASGRLGSIKIRDILIEN